MCVCLSLQTFAYKKAYADDTEIPFFIPFSRLLSDVKVEIASRDAEYQCQHMWIIEAQKAVNYCRLETLWKHFDKWMEVTFGRKSCQDNRKRLALRHNKIINLNMVDDGNGRCGGRERCDASWWQGRTLVGIYTYRRVPVVFGQPNATL